MGEPDSGTWGEPIYILERVERWEIFQLNNTVHWESKTEEDFSPIASLL